MLQVPPIIIHIFANISKPSLTIGYVVAQILVFPIGRAWEKLPRWRVPLGKLTFDVNPGKFTIKEHAFIVIVSKSQASVSWEFHHELHLTNQNSASISAPPPLMPKVP